MHGYQQNIDAIIAAGAVPALVALLHSHQPSAQEEAAPALGDLAFGSHCITDAIIVAGGVPLLAALFASDKPGATQVAASVLVGLADGSQQDKVAINPVIEACSGHVVH